MLIFALSFLYIKNSPFCPNVVCCWLTLKMKGFHGKLLLAHSQLLGLLFVGDDVCLFCFPNIICSQVVLKWKGIHDRHLRASCQLFSHTGLRLWVMTFAFVWNFLYCSNAVRCHGYFSKGRDFMEDTSLHHLNCSLPFIWLTGTKLYQ